MIRRATLAVAAAVAMVFAFDASQASAQYPAQYQGQFPVQQASAAQHPMPMAASQYPGHGAAGSQYNMQDWDRLYHYPYVYYPQNFYGNEYYRSAESLYYRYPQEMRTPVYNKGWQNFYPNPRRYHWGHHFILDVF